MLSQAEEEGMLDLQPDLVRYKRRREKLLREGVLEEEKEPLYSFTCSTCGLQYINTSKRECAFCPGSVVKDEKREEKEEPSPLQDQLRLEEEMAQISSGYPTQGEGEEGSGVYIPSEEELRRWEWAASLNPKIPLWTPAEIDCKVERKGQRCHLLHGHPGTCYFPAYLAPKGLKCKFEDVENEIERICDLMEGHVDDHWMIPRRAAFPPPPFQKKEGTEADKERDERLKKMREGIMRVGPM